MLHLLKVCTALVVCVSASFSQIIAKDCSAYKVNVVKDFDLNKYLGKWYEYERYEAIFQLNTGCVTATYKLRKNGNITVDNRAKNLLFKSDVSIKGEAYPAHPDSTEAKLKVVFFPFVPPGDYWVIGTDYDKYSVVWACQNNIQFLWVLVRNLEIIKEVEPTVNEILDNAGLDRSQLMKTNNKPAVCGTKF